VLLALSCGAKSKLSSASADAGGPDAPIDEPALPCDPDSPGAVTPAPLPGSLSQPQDIAVGGGYLWFAEWFFLADVGRLPLAGGTEEVLAEDRPNPKAIVTEQGRAFWTDTGENCDNGTLSRADGNGRVRELARSLARPSDVVVDERFVYVGDGPEGPCSTAGSVVRFDHDGGDRRVLASGLSRVTGLALTGERVYFGEVIGRIASVPLAGGSPDVLVDSADGVHWLGAEGAWLYFADGRGLNRVPLAGGDVEWLAAVCAQRAEVDESGVYFTCRTFSAPAESLGLFHLDPESKNVTRLHVGSSDLTAIDTDALRIYWVDLSDSEANVWTLCKSAVP
jgi:hypothetical protein